MRYFIRFSYCGTAYHGSQTQPNGITVQQTMEQAFATILRQPVGLTFAGRTDAGVHAEMMYAHFDVADTITDISAFMGRLNNLLPQDIAVQAIMPVRDDAHTRFDAIARTYEYRITEQKNAFLPCQIARVPTGLDYQKMNEAAKALLGKQDFASFCRVHTDVKTTICNVQQAEWTTIPSATASIGIFTICADRFLRNMVRAVVGTLFEVGKGRMTVPQFRDIIAQHNRCAAGQSAPAEGLFLTNITYPTELFIHE
ncbi:MAG: tRNA pseudouridine(38-40) synthase TruA [Paludibacteraceae bacterium]|nr:tRNA pseudouridine(38-40) synthase TruA [Paludibacteraceae bacterium]